LHDWPGALAEAVFAIRMLMSLRSKARMKIIARPSEIGEFA
jgi:hypothetical protein